MKKLIGLAVTGIFIFSSLAFGQGASGSNQFSGNDWLSLSKRERVNIITSFIEAAHEKGISIKKTPVFYAKKLDSFYIKEANRDKQLGNTLKTLMIMEYDWAESGKSKDALAKEWLGDDLYQKNKDRRSKAK